MVSTLGIVWVLISVLTWGISSVGYKLALGTKGSVSRDPITSLGFRYIIVTLVLTPFMLFFFNISDISALSNLEQISYWSYAFLSGLFDVLGHLSYFVALRYLDSSRIYPFINFQMLLTYPISIFVFGETFPRFLLLSAVLIIIGVSFVGKPDENEKGHENLSAEEKKEYYKKGIMYGLGTGACFALFYLSMAMQNRIYSGEAQSNYSRLLLSSIAIWIYILLRQKHIPKKNHKEYKQQIRAYITIGLFACLSAGIGDTVYQMGVTLNGTAISITIASIAPLINQILAILFLKEKFRPKFLLGVILIILGNILVIF